MINKTEALFIIISADGSVQLKEKKEIDCLLAIRHSVSKIIAGCQWHEDAPNIKTSDCGDCTSVGNKSGKILSFECVPSSAFNWLQQSHVRAMQQAIFI